MLDYECGTLGCMKQPETETSLSPIPSERIASKVLLIRGVKVMLDQDLAELYNVETRNLKRQVRRNIERFPEHFMFLLSKQEFDNLRSHFGTSRWGGTRPGTHLWPSPSKV